jgi:perosamine synthetase
MIPHSRPTLDKDDAAAVSAVLKSGHLSQGYQVSQFEKALAAFIGTKVGVAVSSGTAALHLSLLALKIGKGDEVILPSYVCTAPFNAVHLVSATPVIADIDRKTFNVDVPDLKKRITPRTKAIIVPHMFGLPADLDEILSLGIPVIEDCALSIGSRYKGQRTGSFGTLSIFSFYTTKMIATGEGGMVLCSREDIIDAVRDLRDYDEKEEYAVRFNYKMTDLQAALGISQLKKLPSFIEKRKEIAATYSRDLEPLGIQVPFVPEKSEHIYYRYVVRVNSPLKFMEKIHKWGVECRRPVFRPLHRYLGLRGYTTTDEAWDEALSIPLYPSLQKKELQNIIKSVKTALQGYDHV